MQGYIQSVQAGSETTHRTFDTLATFVENMRVNHCGADVLVPEQFLYCSDIVTRFQQVRREAVAKGVAADIAHPPRQATLIDQH